MLECKFVLNGKSMSTLSCGTRNFNAFSGYAPHINNRAMACLKGAGPIPPGKYYITDRPAGMKEKIGNFLGYPNSHHSWFALFAIDDSIDDETKCDDIIRGQFRLHSKGQGGISKGCITLELTADFNILRSLILGTSTKKVNELTVYGVVTVE